MSTQKMSTPEAQGISSRHIARLIDKLEQHQIPMHSLLIARHGKLVFEGYYAPYTQDTLHRMYSQTKSFVSLAIGLLVTDGKIRLDDKICDYFPDYLPGVVHPWIQEMEVQHLLKMQTCYDKTTYDKASTTQKWGRSFFQAVPTHRPGSVFQYDTSGTFVLGELVQRVSGKKIDEFLRERFLDDIGISPELFIMQDAYGVCRGGCGLMAKPRDMMRVALMLMNDGKHPDDYKDPEGRQLYPKEYLKEATSFRTATIQNSYKEDGYGYKFWMMPNGYMMLGMGGQTTLCFADQDVVVVTTADTQGMGNGEDMMMNDIIAEVMENLSEEPLPEDPEGLALLEEKKKTLTIPILKKGKVPNVQAEVDGVDYFMYQNPTGFQRMKLVFEDETKGYLEWEKENGIHKLPFGTGCLAEGYFPEFNQLCHTSAQWCEKNVFYIRVWLTGQEVSSVHLKFAFLPDGGMTLLMKKTEDVYLCEYQGFLNGHK